MTAFQADKSLTPAPLLNAAVRGQVSRRKVTTMRSFVIGLVIASVSAVTGCSKHEPAEKKQDEASPLPVAKQVKPQRKSRMPHRHTVYCKRSFAKVTPELLLNHLESLDFLTLGEDYRFSEQAVKTTRPLRIKDVRPEQFWQYHLFYGKAEMRPIEIDRWETEDQHRAALDETIDNLAIQDKARTKKISELLRKSVDSVSVSFGIDPPARMFAWEVVRYFASQFDGIVHADDGEWLRIGSDYRAKTL
jgi:hypothetical protein